ncbi:hypothetical protein F183_A23550 [Bryobacterales bacterium F-183]|nr:hypothetical protein F183_A23550 [Bryobacterales bacterium F-183]
MPTKKAVVVKSDADATAMASAPTVARAKRTSAKAKPAAGAAAEGAAPASGEAKARSSKAVKTTKAAVTHRHKKQTQQEPAAISAAVATPVVTGTKVAPVVPVMAYEPPGEEVAKLAYSYYVARGYQPGDQAADWFRAINELKARHAAASYLLED